MQKYDRNTKPTRPAVTVALGIFFSLSLGISLFAAGFFVCTLQPTTSLLSRLFSNFEQSAYLPDDTVELAVATRNFTVDPQRQTQAATEVLASQILKAAEHSSAATSIKAPRWHKVPIPKDSSPINAMYELAERGAEFSLGENEISHLIECNKLINTAIPVLVVVAACCLVLGVVLGAKGTKRALGRSFIAAPLLLLVVLLGIGIWALADFTGFFSAFHGLFFPQGNWTFPYESLLICMLPTGFWVAMLFLWITTCLILSLACILIGRHLLR